MKLGYVPYSDRLDLPGDRRRFLHFAHRCGVGWEVADPDRAYDGVVLTPRADLLRWTKYRPDVPLIVDLADSYLAIPRGNVKARLRGAAKWLAGEARSPFFSYRDALEDVLRRAAAVVCATPEQADQIRPLCPNVHPILDFQSELAGPEKSDYSASRPINLVWEGLGTNIRWFTRIADALGELHSRNGLVLHLVTQLEYYEFVMRFGRRRADTATKRLGVPTRLYEWDVRTLPAICTACDIGVIPLPLDRPFESAKPENKLILMWRLGLPVVTSATPAYRRAMAAAGQDLACDSDADWVAVLQGLIESEGDRRKAGMSGRAFAADRYAEEQLLAAWGAVFSSIGLSVGPN